MKYKKSIEQQNIEARELLIKSSNIKNIADTIADESDGDITKAKSIVMAKKIYETFKREYMPRVLDGIRNGYGGRNGEAYGKVNRTRIGIWIQFELNEHKNKPY